MVNALTAWQFETGSADLRLHQALHGYSEGHRLIESSISIPDDLTRLMLRMSDLSGTSVVNGFQEYLTGYPLPSLNAYALAKTWYAPEMPRPGCVWTHTVIIPAPVLARIPCISAVRPLFKRPTERSISDFYSKPVPLDSGHSVLDSQSGLNNQITVMQSFLLSHYQQDWHPLIFSATDSNEFADLIFAVWSQKWPALRMNFTFCTGSLSARTFEKRPLDVQCTPITATRQVSREVAAEGSGEPIVMDIAPPDLPRWTVLAANDALQYEGGPVRSFLWSVSEIDSTRSDFQSFVKLYDDLDRSLPYSDIVEQTGTFFPRAADGRQLKLALLGNHTRPLLRSAESKDVLLALATTDRYESFDAAELSIAQQASRLMAEQPTNGCVLVDELLRASLNPLGEEILTNLIVAMKPENALVIATNRPQFLPTLFRGNPKLAASAQLWLSAGNRKRELFESLIAHQNMEPELVRGIVSALLDSNSEGFIRRAFDQWGRVAVFQALDWSEAHGGSITETCRAALTFHVADVMSWVATAPEKSTATLPAVAHVVAPYSQQVAKNDSTVWLRTFHALQESRRNDEADYVCTFLLGLALCNAPPAPLDLVSESFERVHLLAEKEQLREDAWFILQPLVPELRWGKNWDWCERMRRALMSAFVHYSWPAWELRKRIKNEDVVRQLLRSARKVGGESYFHNV
jgi:GTPase-associated protein 1